MTIFGFGPDSAWFYILGAAAAGAIAVTASIVIGVARVLAQDHRDAKKAPPPSGRGVGPCRHIFEETSCVLPIDPATELEAHSPVFYDQKTGMVVPPPFSVGLNGPVEFHPTVRDHGLTPEEIEGLKDKVSEGGPGWTPEDIRKFREAELKMHKDQVPDAWPPEES